ncbi:MAG TPA: hypothetical protein VH679_01160 [Vicinamibacterales bacterium]
MRLTVDPRQHAFHIVQTSDETGTKVEPSRVKRPPVCRPTVEHIQPGPQNLVDEGLERLATFPGDLLEPCRDVLLECHRGAH